VPKDADREEVLHAIAAVLAGERYVSPRVPKRSHSVGVDAACPGLERLTPRQQGILLMLGNGRLPAQIAAALHVSRSTITFHLRNIARVLGIPTKERLRQWAVLMALESPPPPPFPTRESAPR